MGRCRTWMTVSCGRCTNPALRGRLNVGEIERERALMSPERFAAERLGWWGDPDTEDAGIISLDEWALLRNPDAKQPKRAVLAIDVSPDRRSASIGVAGAGQMAACSHGAARRRAP